MLIVSLHCSRTALYADMYALRNQYRRSIGRSFGDFKEWLNSGHPTFYDSGERAVRFPGGYFAHFNSRLHTNAVRFECSHPGMTCSNPRLLYCLVQKGDTVKMYINGAMVEPKGSTFVDVLNPATQELISRLPETTDAEFEEAVRSSKEAFASWSKTAVPTRARVMFKFQELIRRDMNILAESITMEQGKTIEDARGDVFRGLGMVLLWMFV